MFDTRYFISESNFIDETDLQMFSDKMAPVDIMENVTIDLNGSLMVKAEEDDIDIKSGS